MTKIYIDGEKVEAENQYFNGIKVSYLKRANQ